MILPHLHPGINAEFKRDVLRSRRETDHSFSKMAIDQSHEQNNAVVREDGVAIGLTESLTEHFSGGW